VADSRTVAASLVGAVLGGVMGYLLFTEQGRALRRRMEPALDDFARELTNLRATLGKAVGVANEGWKLLNEALGEQDAQLRYPSPHQASPF